MTEQAFKNLWGSVSSGSNCLDYYSKWSETYDKVGNSRNSWWNWPNYSIMTVLDGMC